MTQENKKTSGEAGAITGYGFQYIVSALLIYDHLKSSTLDWIRLVDTEVGKVDDLLIKSGKTVSAYQIKQKNSENAPPISFAQMFKFKRDNLFYQLADGWKKLKQKYGDDVKVVFLTNMPLSQRNERGLEKSFKKFIELEWNKRQNFTYDQITEVWKPFWEKIFSETCLSEEDFKKFIKNCDLKFSFDANLNNKGLNVVKDVDLNVFKKDIYALTSFIFDVVRKCNNNPIELTAKEILIKLNWVNRAEYFNIHEFPVDRKAYQPIQKTEKELIEKINKIESGYMLLQGSPGSGKSSLISERLHSSDKMKVIKYYSYIPDDPSPSVLRGESIHFLHDISKKLEEIGYNSGQSLRSSNKEHLLQKLFAQFKKIKDDYIKSQKKIILVIDGLDHIKRETHPNRYLLYDLPEPENLPKGIIFLLSSQIEKLEELPSGVEFQINQSERKIIIDKLSKESVFNIIGNLKLNLNNNQRFKIFEKCEGHPLALNLILKKIGRYQDDELNSILENIDKFDETIDQTYYSHWSKIKKNVKLVNLLGFLSRMTENIDLNWIATWEDANTIDIFKKELWFYFEEENNKWCFFHNSFRVFIEYKTIEKPHGGFDVAKGKEFHRMIAQKIDDTPNKFGEIFHFYKAEEYKKIIQISTQRYFKNQFDNFRPVKIILEDINIAILACQKVQNINHIFNLTLSGSIINLIEMHLFEKPIKLIELLLALNKIEIAKSYIRKRNALLIPKKLAMTLVQHFLYFRDEKEARLLFELSEPRELFKDKKISGNNHQDIDILDEWVDKASYFYPVEEIYNLILSIKMEAQAFPIPEEYNLQIRLFYKLGISLIHQKKWNDLEFIFESLKKTNENIYYFGLLFYTWKTNIDSNMKIAKKYFNLSKKIEIKDDKEKIKLAEGYFYIDQNKNKAKEIISSIKYPLKRVKIYSDDHMSLMDRFSLIRLKSALNIPVSLEELIPSVNDQYELQFALIERHFGELAIICGCHYSKKIKSFKILIAKVEKLIRFYNNRLSQEDSGDNYYIRETQGKFCKLLISFVKREYPSEMQNIFNLFKSEWIEDQEEVCWNNNVRRQIISALYEFEHLKSELIYESDKLNVGLPNASMNERIDDYFDHAFFLISLKQENKVEEILKQLMTNSISMNYSKDYQLATWIDWLHLFNKKESQNIRNKIEKFSRYIKIADKTTDGYVVNDSCEKLIKIATNISSRYALNLCKWFLDNGLISFSNHIDYLISGLIAAKQISIYEGVIIIKYILLPISRNSNLKSLETLMKNIKNFSKKDEDIRKISLELMNVITIFSIPENRSNLKRSIIDRLYELNISLEKLNIDWEDMKNKRSFDNELEIDGKVCNYFEVEKQIKSLADLIKIKEANLNKSFNWGKLIKKKLNLISEKTSEKDILQFKEMFKDSNILYMVSDHLYKIERKEISMQLTRELFSDLQPYDWLSYWGGGKTIKAFKALRNHKNSQEIKQKIIDTLADDLQKLDFSFLMMAQEFNEIFKLIYDEIPVQSLWHFIEEYLECIFFAYTEQNFPSPEINESDEGDKIPIIFEILLDLLLHNINIISQGAYLAIYELFQKITDNSLVNKILTKANDEQKILLLNILIGVIFYDSDKSSLISFESLKKIKSDNFYIRILIQKLLKKLNAQHTMGHKGELKKPIKLYDLYFPEPQPSMLHGVEKYDAHKPLPDRNNPIENIRIFQGELFILSEISNISKVNLAIRVNQIMDKLSNGKPYGYEAERNFVNILKSQKLHLSPYRRPKALIAKQAFYYLISELLDMDKISEFQALEITNDLFYIDPLLINFKWRKKPNFIKCNFSKNQTTDNWVAESIKLNELNVGKEVEGMIVIGELREMKNNERLLELEKTEQVLSFSENFENDNAIQNNKIYYQDYQKQSESFDILYRNNGVTFDTENAEWVAVNPWLMKKYNMVLSEENVFTWLTNQGKIVAKTFCWKDGILEHMDLNFQKQLGKGMLCLLDKDLLQKISSENKIYLKVMRRRECCLEEQDSRMSKTVKFCKPWDVLQNKKD